MFNTFENKKEKFNFEQSYVYIYFKKNFGNCQLKIYFNYTIILYRIKIKRINLQYTVNRNNFDIIQLKL